MSLPLDRLVMSALEQFSERQPSRSLIPRDNLPYLYRTYLEGKDTPDGKCGLFLHKFVASDENMRLHNHPWSWATSFILTGKYKEFRSRHNQDFPVQPNSIVLAPVTAAVLGPGDINYIDRNDFHRVEILNEEVWTLFLHGPRCGDWGFVNQVEGEPQNIDIIKVRTKDRTITGEVK